MQSSAFFITLCAITAAGIISAVWWPSFFHLAVSPVSEADGDNVEFESFAPIPIKDCSKVKDHDEGVQ